MPFLGPLGCLIPPVEDLELVDLGAAIISEVDPAEDKEAVGGSTALSTIHREAMRPARAWNVSIHGESLPLHLVKVEQADVVQGNVLCSREYLVVSSTIDNEEEMLIPVSEYRRRVHDTWAGWPP